MDKKDILKGVVHDLPSDLEQELISNYELLNEWNNLTDLARNEWICWLISVKKEQTRMSHLRRLKEDILNGKKRPCCWPGCPHRK